MGPGDIVPTWLSVAMDGTGLNRAHLLIAGVAIYRWSKKRMSFTELYLMLIVVLLAHHWHPPANDAVLAYAVALVLICVAAYEPAWNGKLFTRFERQIRWLAGISYGVYLMHYVMGTIVARHLADLGVPWWGWVPAWFVVAIVLGWAHQVRGAARVQRAGQADHPEVDESPDTDPPELPRSESKRPPSNGAADSTARRSGKGCRQPAESGPIARVVSMPLPLDRTFDYQVPRSTTPTPCRMSVRVRFAGKSWTGTRNALPRPTTPAGWPIWSGSCPERVLPPTLLSMCRAVA